MGALYFIDNDPACNHVIASAIMSDGSLKLKRAVVTGGKGGSGTSGNETDGPDALFSQGAIAIGGNVLGSLLALPALQLC